MNNNAQLKTIGKIILILVVLAILLAFIYSKYGSIGEALKKIFDLGEEEPDYHVLNEQAQKGFSVMLNDIDKCLKSKQAECGCYISFSSFSQTHAIKTDSKKIYLLNVKNENEITVADKELNNLNCLMNDNFEAEDQEPIIRFDKESTLKHWLSNKEAPYIKNSGFGANVKLIYKFNIYKKDGRICWLTDKVKEENVNNIQKCQ